MAQIVIQVSGKNPLNSEYKIRSNVRRALNESTERVRQSFLENERGYTGGINIQLDRSHPDYQDVYSSDYRFYFTNVGTRPHTIAASAGKSLAFGSTYIPGTQVYTIGAKPAQASGNTVFAKAVKHPGVDAREVNRAIADKHRAVFVKAVRTALLRGI